MQVERRNRIRANRSGQQVRGFGFGFGFFLARMVWAMFTFLETALAHSSNQPASKTQLGMKFTNSPRLFG